MQGAGACGKVSTEFAYGRESLQQNYTEAFYIIASHPLSLVRGKCTLPNILVASLNLTFIIRPASETEFFVRKISIHKKCYVYFMKQFAWVARCFFFLYGKNLPTFSLYAFKVTHNRNRSVFFLPSLKRNKEKENLPPVRWVQLRCVQAFNAAREEEQNTTIYLKQYFNCAQRDSSRYLPKLSNGNADNWQLWALCCSFDAFRVHTRLAFFSINIRLTRVAKEENKNKILS